MHHADRDARKSEKQRQRMVDDAKRHEEAIERAIALQDQHPGKGAHQHADP